MRISTCHVFRYNLYPVSCPTSFVMTSSSAEFCSVEHENQDRFVLEPQYCGMSRSHDNGVLLVQPDLQEFKTTNVSNSLLCEEPSRIDVRCWTLDGRLYVFGLHTLQYFSLLFWLYLVTFLCGGRTTFRLCCGSLFVSLLLCALLLPHNPLQNRG